MKYRKESVDIVNFTKKENPLLNINNKQNKKSIRDFFLGIEKPFRKILRRG